MKYHVFMKIHPLNFIWKVKDKIQILKIKLEN